MRPAGRRHPTEHSQGIQHQEPPSEKSGLGHSAYRSLIADILPPSAISNPPAAPPRSKDLLALVWSLFFTRDNQKGRQMNNSNDRNYRSVGSWRWMMFVTAVPIIGLIMVFVWALTGENESRKNYYRAMLAWALIFIALICDMNRPQS